MINNAINMDKVIQRALIDSLGTAAYIVLVVLFIFSFQIFSEKKDVIIIPISKLLLFVSSAAITGFLVFGKPVMLYVDGKKREAVSLLGYTLVMLFLITLVSFISMIGYYSFFY